MFYYQRLLLLMLSAIWLTCSLAAVQPISLSTTPDAQNRYMGIRLLGTLQINPTTSNGLKLGGLSGLAWDADEDLLYAISDRGNIFHLRPIIVDNELKNVKLIAAYPLKNKVKRSFIPFLKQRDSEGLTLRNSTNNIRQDTELIISFEQTPKIIGFNAYGIPLHNYPVPAPLNDVSNYTSPNASLEAVTIIPDGTIVTTSERQLRGQSISTITLYGLDGRLWQVPAQNWDKNSIVALEALDDNAILTLERSYVSMFHPYIISLRWIDLPQLNSDHKSTEISVKTIAVLNSGDDWVLDNFEGLTRHQGLRFFMVSDNNFSMLQSTLLTYFEVLR